MRILLLAAFLFGSALFPGQVCAELDPTAKNLEFTRLECAIASIDPQASTILACETVIRLVDVVEKGRRLRTILATAAGQSAPLGTFYANQRIFVRGFRQPDGSLLAREIYQLPGDESARDLSFYRVIPDWDWESSQ